LNAVGALVLTTLITVLVAVVWTTLESEIEVGSEPEWVMVVRPERMIMLAGCMTGSMKS